MNILYIDIETAPNLSYIWGQFEQNAIAHVQEWSLLGFAYAWGDGDPVPVYPSPSTNAKTLPSREKAIVKAAWKLFDEADVVIAHNGDRFDIRKLNAKFISHGLTPPSPYLTIDTKKIASRVAMFNSNSLDNLGQHLGLGQKVKHEGWEMWEGCLAGEKKWWNKMIGYNIQDVVLLRKLYYTLRPWDNRHPNLCTDGQLACSKCMSTDVHKRKYKRMSSGLVRVTLHCQSCGGYSSLLKSGKVRQA